MEATANGLGQNRQNHALKQGDARPPRRVYRHRRADRVHAIGVYVLFRLIDIPGFFHGPYDDSQAGLLVCRLLFVVHWVGLSQGNRGIGLVRVLRHDPTHCWRRVLDLADGLEIFLLEVARILRAQLKRQFPDNRVR